MLSGLRHNAVLTVVLSFEGSISQSSWARSPIFCHPVPASFACLCISISLPVTCSSCVVEHSRFCRACSTSRRPCSSTCVCLGGLIIFYSTDLPSCSPHSRAFLGEVADCLNISRSLCSMSVLLFLGSCKSIPTQGPAEGRSQMRSGGELCELSVGCRTWFCSLVDNNMNKCSHMQPSYRHVF